MQALIDSQGFNIDKKTISKELLLKIKKDLNVTPVINFGNFVAMPIKVFIETEDTIIVPIYYAINELKVEESSNVFRDNHVDFPHNCITLRQNQQECSEICLKEKTKDYGGGIINLSTGGGKCLKIDTPILMFDGSIKMVQDIKQGELLMGDDSTPRKVLTLARGRDVMYEISPVKGESYTVNQEHILCLKTSGKPTIVNNNSSWKVKWVENNKRKIKSFKTLEAAEQYKKTVNHQKITEIAVKEYIKLPKSVKHILKGYKVPIDFPEKKLEFDPYIIGVWLGDGDSNGPNITNQDSTIIHYLSKNLPKYYCYLQYCNNKGYNQIRYRINGCGVPGKRNNFFLNELNRQKLINNKHIPEIYKCNSRENRLKLLAGLLDTDGSINDNCFDFIQKSEKLIDDVIYLCRSLGFACYKSRQKKGCWYKNEYKENFYYRISIYGDKLHEIPVLCPRKKPSQRKQIKDVLVNGIKVKEIGIGDYYGFEINGNRRFVLGDFTVTHNTVLALKLAAEFQKKTLIVVNKTELARQWRQEIEKFIPGTKIGTIQGSTFDIEGAQIVIGMLQTISIKSHLSHKNFEWVGLGIIDECHNISSEVFSRVMFKVRPKFLFGLTATLERKDKTEQIIKWYIGDTLYSDKDNSLKQQTDIHIYKYTGKSSVEKFLRDGTVAISEMLSNLAEDPERTALIVKILKELLLDKTKNIILLADRTGILKKLLKYFPEEAGLFIGSCKPDQLLAAKEKRLLLATYAMASEGFSLEKLNCLVFATPRSSITQALGRIYRKRHGSTPVIVDIVDNFSVFKGQSFKRKKIYKESIENPYFLEKNGSNPKKDSKNGKVLVLDIFDNTEECLIED